MNKRWEEERERGGREGGREDKEAFCIDIMYMYIHLHVLSSLILSPSLFLSPSLSLSLSHQIVIQSVCETVVPKLIAEDIPLLHSLLQDVFPGVPYRRAEMAALRKEISSICKECHLIFEMRWFLCLKNISDVFIAPNGHFWIVDYEGNHILIY